MMCWSLLLRNQTPPQKKMPPTSEKTSFQGSWRFLNTIMVVFKHLHIGLATVSTTCCCIIYVWTNHIQMKHENVFTHGFMGSFPWGSKIQENKVFCKTWFPKVPYNDPKKQGPSYKHYNHRCFDESLMVLSWLCCFKQNTMVCSICLGCLGVAYTTKNMKKLSHVTCNYWTNDGCACVPVGLVNHDGILDLFRQSVHTTQHEAIHLLRVLDQQLHLLHLFLVTHHGILNFF